MFGLPRETKLDFLIGCELLQMAVGEFQLILHFSHSVDLSVESKLELKASADSVSLIWEPKRLSDLARFATIVGLSVTDYEIPGDGRLILHFGNGGVLTAYDSNKDHESYQVTRGSETFIV
jgi:hypothetical protein